MAQISVFDQSKKYPGVSLQRVNNMFPTANSYGQSAHDKDIDSNESSEDCINNSMEMAEPIEYNDPSSQGLTTYGLDEAKHRIQFPLHPVPDHIKEKPKFKSNFKFYAVANGNILGVYETYDQYAIAIKDVRDAYGKGFNSYEEACDWLLQYCLKKQHCSLMKHIKQVDGQFPAEQEIKFVDKQITEKSSRKRKAKDQIIAPEVTMALQQENKKLFTEKELLQALKEYNESLKKTILSQEIRMQSHALQEESHRKEVLDAQLRNIDKELHMTINGTEIVGIHQLASYCYKLPPGAQISGLSHGFKPWRHPDEPRTPFFSTNKK